MRFHATIALNGKTATGIEVPADVLAALGPGKRPKVTVTINGYSYPSTVGVMGGRSLLPVSADVRAKAGVAAGDEVDVDVEPDTAPRTVEVPADLAQALDRVPAARAAFGRLSYSGQQRYVLGIEQAKTAETRQRRVAKAVAELSATAAPGGGPALGRRRPSAKHPAPSPQQPPARLAVGGHLRTAKPHPGHGPGQRPPLVRCQRMPVSQRRAAHLE